MRYTASELTSLLQNGGGVKRSVESLTLTYSDLGNVIQVKVNYTNGESSTILTALRTGRASYNVLQDINNHRGERVLLESTTIPIVVDGRVECVVDSSKYHTIDQRVIRGGEGGGLSTLDRMLTEDPAMLASRAASGTWPGWTRRCSSMVRRERQGAGAESLHSEGGRAGPFCLSKLCGHPGHPAGEPVFWHGKGKLHRRPHPQGAAGGGGRRHPVPGRDQLHGPALQAKLLKVLEEKKVRRLGGSRDIPFDVRIVAAVNEKPQKLIREGRLREDLYYRLGVIRLTLPPCGSGCATSARLRTTLSSTITGSCTGGCGG